MARPHPLRQTQYRAHLDIDGAMDPLGGEDGEAARIVLRHSLATADGTRRITALGAVMIEWELSAMLARAEPALAGGVHAAVLRAERLGGEG